MHIASASRLNRLVSRLAVAAALLLPATVPVAARAWWTPGGIIVGVVPPALYVGPPPAVFTPPPVVYTPPPTLYAPPTALYGYDVPPRRFWVPDHWDHHHWQRGRWEERHWEERRWEHGQWR